MGNRETLSETKARAIAAGLAAGMVGAMAILTLSGDKAVARAMIVMPEASPEVVRIAKSYETDAPRARLQMVSLYRSNGLNSAADYRVAANLFARSKTQDDLLLAHDLALASLALGDPEARRLVASTEDRLFAANGLGERFGTLGGKALPLTDTHRNLFVQLKPPRETVSSLPSPLPPKA